MVIFGDGAVGGVAEDGAGGVEEGVTIGGTVAGAAADGGLIPCGAWPTFILPMSADIVRSSVETSVLGAVIGLGVGGVGGLGSGGNETGVSRGAGTGGTAVAGNGATGAA